MSIVRDIFDDISGTRQTFTAHYIKFGMTRNGRVPSNLLKDVCLEDGRQVRDHLWILGERCLLKALGRKRNVAVKFSAIPLLKRKQSGVYDSECFHCLTPCCVIYVLLT